MDGMALEKEKQEINNVKYIKGNQDAQKSFLIIFCEAEKVISPSRYRRDWHRIKMKLGIVGLPNVGKSTLFNSLTKAGAESANYPFCTIDPNVGVVTVPDERLKLLGIFITPRR